MGQDDACTAMLGGVGDDVAQGEGSAAFIAVMASEVDAVRAVVDMRDPHAFPRGVAFREATRKEGLGGGRAVDLQREFGTLIPHSNLLGEGEASRHFNLIHNGLVTRLDA